MTSGLEALQKGMQLREAGLIPEAAHAFRKAAESGIAEGFIQLARIELERGDRATAHALMRKAELLAKRGDAFANLCCSLAYQLGYGEGTVEMQGSKARHFLRRAAELNSAMAQTMLAQQLLWGLNGEVRDESEYEKWILKAVAQGFEDAIVTHVRNILHLGREIDASLIGKLENLAPRSKHARELLERIKHSE